MKYKCFANSLLSISMLTLALMGCDEQKQVEKKPINADKPNVVIFYVDDLGWGDLSSYGATEVSTPNVDELANNGIRFTDAHSAAATCTPSRYSLLTGQYAFRNNAAVLQGDAGLIIDPAMPTLPKMFKKAGYKTAVVGKWHLGLGDGNVNWNTAVKPGPLEIGFDYSFLLPATGDRVPSVYLENHHVVNLDKSDPLFVNYKKRIGDREVGTENKHLLRQWADPQHSDTVVNGISRIGWMAGGKSAEWVDEEFPFVFTEKANNFIRDNKDEPFMLFFAFHDIHVPRLPNDMFKGATSMGPRGDAIVQMDWMTGKVVEELKKHGLMENTIIVFSSDNGPVLDDGYDDDAETKLGKHNPAGEYRGGKYSAYEAGTRVPMIVHYPAGIKKKGVSDSLINQLDLYRSFARLLNIKVADDEAFDSEDVLDALLDADVEARSEMLGEAYVLSLRQQQWKYISAFGKAAPKWIEVDKGIESGMTVEHQLYDLSKDAGEQNNLASKFPEIAEEMKLRLEEIKQKTKYQP